MNHPSNKGGPGLMLAAVLVLPALLAGCGDRDDGRTVGQRIDSALGRAGQAARGVREGGHEAAQDARTAVMGAGREAREAASAAGAKIDDAAITSKVKSGLAADKDLSALSINVDTHEGVVTLRGTAPTVAARSRAGEIARHVKDVRAVENQLQVKSG